ncbi:mitochondrial ribonuclease P catalytic subunit-like isoform X2 [Montipora capricornis]|uniref:mitochondrial ribonuclease P catalytic subunit-like isoform X2 n=1 Tax=Montipora capricornis TaxID=246305 RepID=UPI0035F150B3
MPRFVSLHKRRAFSEIPSVLRLCVTGGRRQWSFTSTRHLNKVLEKGNVDENNHDRLHVGDIRWLCEAEQTPQKVSNLFSQCVNLPDKYRIECLNSALYWYLYYGKIEEALAIKSLWEKEGFPKTYSSYCNLAILYSKCHQLGEMKDFLDKMKRDGLTPKARHYEPFVEAAIERGDIMGAFEAIKEMERSAVIHGLSSNLCTALIRACTGKEDKHLTCNVLKIFQDFVKYRYKLTDDALEAIKIWFDRHGQTKWITSWTIATQTFHCYSCKQKLETGEFSIKELEELKLSLVKHLWKPHRTVQQVKSFTSAGNFIDYVLPEQLNRIPLSVEYFLESTGPYDVIIDGLNVGYFRGFFDPYNVQNVVLHFVNKKKRVLVVGSSPMRLSERSKRGGKTPLGALVEYLTDHKDCGLICLPECSVDDLYFLSAAMHCGPGTLLVSNDRFHDYTCDMDPLLKIQFNRWQKLYQFKLERFVDESPLFAPRNEYTPAVQTSGDTWHFPSSDGNRWLCIQKGTS